MLNLIVGSVLKKMLPASILQLQCSFFKINYYPITLGNACASVKGDCFIRVFCYCNKIISFLVLLFYWLEHISGTFVRILLFKANTGRGAK